MATEGGRAGRSGIRLFELASRFLNDGPDRPGVRCHVIPGPVKSAAKR